MKAQFWLDRWNEGQIGFHQEVFQEKLLKYFPTLSPRKDQSVLVPLSGKTKDLIWLNEQGLKVHGVELAHKAVEAFLAENNLSAFHQTQDQDFTHYSINNLKISCGDFFKLNTSVKYDFIYDRASLVALPPEMRIEYARVITDALDTNGKYLLFVYQYNQEQLEGPPFSIDKEEITKLYGAAFNIEMLESEEVKSQGSKLNALSAAKQNIYLLTKKS